MFQSSRIWLKKRYNLIINSIAFYPAFIGFLFLLLTWGMIALDYSDYGKSVKSSLSWLSLKDASTARTIISTIVGGVISLTVFSFSMVMIVLNQAASQMTNRVLNKLIGNRFQQIVLGIYIGTIVYALFLLSIIRDIDSRLYIPALSTYLLILVTIFDIFLFIYFLHYITQSVKYEVIIRRIYKDTKESMERICLLDNSPSSGLKIKDSQFITAKSAGIYEELEKDTLLDICVENDCVIQLLHPPGTYILEGQAYIKVDKQLPGDTMDDIRNSVMLNSDESIESNYMYGFKQLMEIAIRALSPGINDPGTAVISLRSLFNLLNTRLHHYPENEYRDDDGKVRVLLSEITFEMIFRFAILPIWDYGKEDRAIRFEMNQLVSNLVKIKPNEVLRDFQRKIQEELKTPI